MLIYLFSFVVSHSVEKSSPWSFNPNCPTEDAARDCEDVCITTNAKCILDCEGDQECIRQCSRNNALCVENCPCYSECYDGCPCPNENDYCETCASRFKKEYNICRDSENQELNSCLTNCSFNETCDNECFVGFNNAVKVRNFHCDSFSLIEVAFIFEQFCPSDNFFNFSTLRWLKFFL